MRMFMCHKIRVEVRRQLAEVRSLIPLCGFQKLNSGCEVLASGAFVPQHQPKKTFFKKQTRPCTFLCCHYLGG